MGFAGFIYKSIPVDSVFGALGGAEAGAGGAGPVGAGLAAVVLAFGLVGTPFVAIDGG